MKNPQQRADLAVRKEERAREGAKAWREYEAAGVAARARMAKLRALRLAKGAIGGEKE